VTQPRDCDCFRTDSAFGLLLGFWTVLELKSLFYDFNFGCKTALSDCIELSTARGEEWSLEPLDQRYNDGPQCCGAVIGHLMTSTDGSCAVALRRE